jgi:S-DNA-T family DNA segregation ATPase FtsK/SpoIIIE
MSGKTTLLQTLLFGLIKNNDASKINVFVADYNSRILKSFEKCPQVGSVYFDDEEEKANKMVRMIQKELVNRKRKLSEVGIGSFREYCRRFNDLPAIIFAIDNYSAYTELNPKHEEDFIVLSRESSSYGIYLLFTINNPNDLRTRIRQNFPSGIGLQLADRFEYESILSEKIDLVADYKIAGRGMVKTNIPLEFQVAIAVKADFSQINQKISEEFESMFFEYEGVLAKSIPTLPEDLSLEHLLKSYPMINSFASGLPVGYDSDESTPISIDLFSSFCISISGASRTGKSTLMRNWIKYTNKLNSRNVLIDRVDSSHSQDGINTHISTAEQLFDFLQNDLRNEFISRGDIKTQFSNNKSANKSDFYKKTKPLFIFIPDFTFFLELIYNYEKDMKKFMEQTISVGKGYGIYFIATVTNNDMTSDYNSKRVFRSFIGYKEGFHLGGQTDQQRIFDFDIPVFERSKRTGVGVGHIIDEGKTKKVIVLQ